MNRKKTYHSQRITAMLMALLMLFSILWMPPVSVSAKTTYGGVVHNGKYAEITVNFVTKKKAATIASIEGAIVYEDNYGRMQTKTFVRKNNITRKTTIRKTVGSRGKILDVSPIVVTFKSGNKKILNYDPSDERAHKGSVHHDNSTPEYKSGATFNYEWDMSQMKYIITGMSYITPIKWSDNN